MSDPAQDTARAFAIGAIPIAELTWERQVTAMLWILRHHSPDEGRRAIHRGWRMALGEEHANCYDASYIDAWMNDLQAMPTGRSIGELLDELAARRGLRDQREIDSFMRDWESGRLPLLAWGHREHLLMALVYLQRHGRERAEVLAAEGIRRFNAGHGVPPEAYHHTVTLALIRLIDHWRAQQDPTRSLPDSLPDLFATFCDKGLLRRHYSPDVLRRPEARRSFVPPDLQPLPE